MYNDRHAVLIRLAEHPTQLLQMFGLIHLHVGVAEVQLDAVFEIRILSAALKFLKRVFLERVETAKCAQPFGILRCLGRGPVVLSTYLCIFVLDGARWATVHVSNGQQEPSSNTGRIEMSYHITRIKL